MTEEQDEKMELLKSYFREKHRNMVDLAAELRKRQQNASDGLGPSVDRLYAEIEEGRFSI